ncbi:ABC transporter ATP-binding protein [Lacticaseibacillus manihotivorans]|jgi:ABC-2 type transport system ATP-binding protein|uniref:ABC-type multidrug transport system, ATPase component n=2 Tax=Lacticaseibacillus manihotivorans TaxID=88233 RepID=A0A0R1R6T3_9LACO|nr:ABC transporter ATP-binding protein [Lacticaseibacillus manihotivorans]KRL52476.1 ABC-type multidrug transport system, ATPase component [Lacticaseibacillus manihotivorans DSM 13343 = JCM 12514]QFQ92778.1 ATP-binding cassette domain-containing protein [Lacticaseibacillus manihotivorans]
MADLLIDLKHLQKKFGKETVLKDVTLQVAKGEILGLIGPSGAGKSTVIKTALGMEVADGGQALVLDTKMPNRQLLGRIGYMAQDDALYEALSAEENLRFFGRMKGVDKTQMAEQIAHVAAVVDLTPDLKKTVSGYSGGMKRRLSLAIALLGDPELLILDEPTVGIDPALRRKIWKELHGLRDAGRGVLITTHVMDEAELVDNVALLLGGQVMAYGAPGMLEAQYNVKTIEQVFLKAEGVA